MSDELQQAASALAGEAPIGRTLLLPFSGLERAAALRLPRLLAAFSIERQRQIVESLVGEGERSFDVDFGLVYRALLSHTDAEIRRLCIEGLWEDTRLDLVPLLLQALESDPDTSVRAAAAEAMGRYIYAGEVDELPASRARAIRQALEQQYLMDDVPLDIARRALESLAYINDDTIKAYIDRAYSSDREEMRQSAVFAMGRSADPCWADIVLAELYSDSATMRFEAVRACGDLQLREAVDSLDHIVNGRDIELRLMAVQALGQIGGERARKLLERYQEADDPDLAEAAEEALAESSLADMVFDMLVVDPLDADLVADDQADEGDEEEDAYRAEFHAYTHEDDDQDDEWPDEYLSLE